MGYMEALDVVVLTAAAKKKQQPSQSNVYLDIKTFPPFVLLWAYVPLLRI